jgi:hypothetical protein
MPRAPWPEALAAFAGEKDIAASAIAEYFTPLNGWLIKQNKGKKCGWLCRLLTLQFVTGGQITTLSQISCTDSLWFTVFSQ